MKIETKWWLWECIISSWEYSDYSEEHIVVSANNLDEAKNSIKIYVQNDEYRNKWKWWLIFDDWEKWQYQKKDGWINWNKSYWHAEDVYIQRLDVIYTWWEIAKKTILEIKVFYN